MSGVSVDLNEQYVFRGATVRWAKFGEGPPVVLCHGTPWSSFVWRHIIAHIAHTHTVYAWDMVGYGVSDKRDGDVSLAFQGELLSALFDTWNLQESKPAVVAHDYGGAVALRAHLLHGVKMRSLMLIDIVALRPWGSPFFKLVGEHSEVFAALPSNLHAALVREYIAGASAVGLPLDVHDALVEPWLGDGQAAFYRQIAQAGEQYTAVLEPLFASITIPTRIVWGTHDTWIPIDRAHSLVSAIPNSELVEIHGAGHLVQEDRTSELIETIVDWLK